eukprot:6589293-Pyramimonas_sp.AAC.1
MKIRNYQRFPAEAAPALYTSELEQTARWSNPTLALASRGWQQRCKWLAAPRRWLGPSRLHNDAQ